MRQREETHTAQAKILTVQQAAEQLQVSERTVYEWLRNGKIPGRKIGKVWRLSEDAIVDFLRGEAPENYGESSPASGRNGRR
ncbi:MAG TPA: helix-turn-helix domain-containing protein [Candidatus Binatia bacterium]|jgi:excisionase family DNA binding protein|nr:helix-turn-helix domain-containing protein [Candidatus Binatia bacterium]